LKAVKYYYKDDCDYANKRLQNTYVLTSDNDLFLVSNVFFKAVGTNSKTLKPLVELTTQGLRIRKDGKTKVNPNEGSWGIAIEELPTESLNMEPLSLGYVLSKRRKEAIFLSRYPSRTSYKQGLFMGAVRTSCGSKSDVYPDELLQPVFNTYPNLSEALALTKSFSTVPFSRAFAVERSTKNVLYRGSLVVGEAVKGGGKDLVRLFPQFSYLQQHLDWSLK